VPSLNPYLLSFMYSSGFIASFNEVNELHVDSQRWVVTCSLARTPDPDLLTRRVYTAGCGKGVMYADLSELASRGPLQSPLQVDAGSIVKLATWLQHCSALYRDTGTVHSAALSIAGAAPQAAIDDVGRHNAVDKVIGEHLMRAAGFADVVLICSGRISSEILHKARKAGIPMVVARGAPTHQAVLRARDMGVTVVGFARGGRFTVYSHSERICV
jgi:FdhD protein